MAVFSLVGKKVLKKFIYNKSKVWIYFIAPSFQSPGWKIRSPGVLIAFKFVIFFVHSLFVQTGNKSLVCVSFWSCVSDG